MKNDKKVPQFRHELKYLIRQSEAEMLKERLSLLLERDAHAANGVYLIRSLYFDDIWESAYEEKLAGVASRKKYRIRIYNYSDATIRLECKRKEGACIQKTSAALSREETEKILAGDYWFLAKRGERICQNFYRECAVRRMRPSVIVDYDREPFVSPYGTVRITFDSHVRAGLLSNNLFDEKLPVAEVLQPGWLILEVKFTEYLPESLRQILPIDEAASISASKYTLCLERKKELAASLH